MAKYIKAVECAEIISEKFNIPLADLVDVFAEINTADVVPKSEVEKIFEEIERFLYLQFRFCKEEIGNDDTEYIKGRLEMNTQIQSFIAELKKKHAGVL